MWFTTIARHYIMTTKETYDIIASDPLDVWVKGTASIYTEDYFRRGEGAFESRRIFHFVCAALPDRPDHHQKRVGGRFSGCPNGTGVGQHQLEGQGYDLVLMGQNSPLKVDISAVQARLDQPDFAPVRVSLDQIGFESAAIFYASFAAQQSDLAGWLKGAQINTDRNFAADVLAGWTYKRRPGRSAVSGDIGDAKAPHQYFHRQP